MIARVADLSSASLAAFDDVIDVRSPAEYAEDRLPRAISLPALSNDERAAVGAVYKQVSPFAARRIGAAMVARNVAAGLETTLADRPRDWSPLVYCWRGGQRSGAVATILAAVGWRVAVVDGGWKAWRRRVVAATRGAGPDLPVLLVDGQTGCAKTEILARAAALGAPAIDLEGAANHRGSAFGAVADAPQPSQKRFESLIYEALEAPGPAGARYLVEAESALVGALRIPARVWRSMKAAPRIEVRAPLDARVAFTLETYTDVASDASRLIASIDLLAKAHPKETIEAWRAMARTGDHAALVAALMTEHYDPLYERSRRKRMDRPAAVVELPGLDAAALDIAAAEAARIARTG
ncbi:MAG: tRNA 2-selenouridine(34) synthase MnmH [Alphaproteobacteria bacterium]|nr:tRNA 2-selenouridine(34) synthase MnmH [Alphaproteobacteria bacterium]